MYKRESVCICECRCENVQSSVDICVSLNMIKCVFSVYL